MAWRHAFASSDATVSPNREDDAAAKGIEHIKRLFKGSKVVSPSHDVFKQTGFVAFTTARVRAFCDWVLTHGCVSGTFSFALIYWEQAVSSDAKRRMQLCAEITCDVHGSHALTGTLILDIKIISPPSKNTEAK